MLFNYYLPSLLFGLGSLWIYFFPPKNISPYMGYRSTNAMKNQKNWDFSQRYVSQRMSIIALGIVLLQTLFLLILPTIEQYYALIIVFLYLLGLGIVAQKLEKILEKNEADKS